MIKCYSNHTFSIFVFLTLFAALLSACVFTTTSTIPPVVDLYIIADTQTIDPGGTVNFDFFTTFDAETVNTWAWDFGDGTVSTEATPSHVYDAPGDYTVSLAVTSTSGKHTQIEQNLVSVRTPDDAPGVVGEERSFAGIPFMWIPAGNFVMGSDDPGYSDAHTQPLRTVTISRGFWMSKYEITQGQWIQAMGENPAYFPEPTGNRPIEQVGWDQAQDFISRLNEGGEGTFRLPTEAEWEYACRAGSTGEFYWGDDIETSIQNGWTWENARFLTRLTGLLRPNAWGLYDMSGNVWEWCTDYYDPDYYAAAPLLDPVGPAWTPYRVARGGSWYNFAHEARSAHRFGFIPDSAYNNIGFRICRN